MMRDHGIAVPYVDAERDALEGAEDASRHQEPTMAPSNMSGTQLVHRDGNPSYVESNLWASLAEHHDAPDAAEDSDYSGSEASNA